ncbi:FAD:protein FMN transferase [bacterium]|nr:FAD:protein FMN transferase [bacterium]MBU1065484.1 FAD:protein FMN transferase [bacterium]MBU1634837.1 FAD:protein FMN transferase [bacterium]MBU1873141.1 FAD:protein FMN transferase [bacterium]
MKKVFFTLILIGIIAGLSGCNSDSPLKPYQVTRFAMGTVIEITVLDNSEYHANMAIAAAMTEINRIGSLFYEGNPESPLYEFSHRTGDRVAMPEEVLSLIQRGLEVSRLTNGCFDMTVGVLMPLWDFKSENPKPPTEDQIESVLPYVNYQTLTVDPENNMLLSASPRTMLTTGGIAKGYAVDRAIEILSENGVKGALVNAGGDLRVLCRADGKKWRVGIQNPRVQQEILKIIEIDSGAVVTSGDYQKFFFYNEKRFHHLLNPKTGLPADSCQFVTIIAPTTEQADALATGIFVAGARQGIELLEKIPSTEGLIVRHDGKIFKSSGFNQ